MLTFGFMTVGIQKNIANSTVIGFFLGLFFIISMAIIQAKKISGEWFKETFSSDDVNYENIAFGEDFGRFIMENISLLGSNWILAFFTFIILVLLMLMFGIFNDGIFTDKNSFLFITLLPLNIYITILIVSLRNKTE
jgi:uncharacterized membrane protein YeiB